MFSSFLAFPECFRSRTGIAPMTGFPLCPKLSLFKGKGFSDALAFLSVIYSREKWDMQWSNGISLKTCMDHRDLRRYPELG